MAMLYKIKRSMAHLATLKLELGQTRKKMISHTTSVHACTLRLHIVITVICPNTEEDDHIHTTSVHVPLIHIVITVICPNKTKLYDVKLAQT